MLAFLFQIPLPLEETNKTRVNDFSNLIFKNCDDTYRKLGKWANEWMIDEWMDGEVDGCWKNGLINGTHSCKHIDKTSNEGYFLEFASLEGWER